MAIAWAIVTASCRTVTGIKATTSPMSSRTPSLDPSASSMKMARATMISPHTVMRMTSPGWR